MASQKVMNEVRAHFGFIPKSSGKRQVSENRRLLALDAKGKKAILTEKIVKTAERILYIPMALTIIR